MILFYLPQSRMEKTGSDCKPGQTLFSATTEKNGKVVGPHETSLLTLLAAKIGDDKIR